MFNYPRQKRPEEARTQATPIVLLLFAGNKAYTQGGSAGQCVCHLNQACTSPHPDNTKGGRGAELWASKHTQPFLSTEKDTVHCLPPEQPNGQLGCHQSHLLALCFSL